MYDLDDPYIHMAMAKNLLQHGVWGVTKYGFSSSSSSLLQTLLLCVIYLLFGVNEISPLIFNVIFATLIVWTVYALLRRHKLAPFYTFAVLLSIIYVTPLPAVTLSGMEHIVHTLITIPFVYLSAYILSKDRSTLLDRSLLLVLLVPLVMARYEGLFLALVVGGLFAMRRQLLYSSVLLGVAIIPAAVYGAISMKNGWYFLPNSLLLKGNTPELSLSGIGRFLYRVRDQMTGNPHMLVLVSAALLLFIFQHDKQKTIWKSSTIMLIIFTATTFLHLLFARIGWFFRYEAYLVALGLFVLAIVMREYLPGRFWVKFDTSLIPKYAAIALLIPVVVSPLAGRAVQSLKRTPQATTNIYEQQYQMGLFLREFYQGEAVAANDVGAINYLADINCIDLWGLGSLEVARAKREGSYDSQQICDLARQKNVKIAIVYDHWLDAWGGIPLGWVKVGVWKIPDNVVCAGDTVSFYAVDPLEKDNLIENLRVFSSRLPKEVVQSGKYTR